MLALLDDRREYRDDREDKDNRYRGAKDFNRLRDELPSPTFTVTETKVV